MEDIKYDPNKTSGNKNYNDWYEKYTELDWWHIKCYFHKLEGIETTWNEEQRKMTKQSEEHPLTLE